MVILVEESIVYPREVEHRLRRILLPTGCTSRMLVREFRVVSHSGVCPIPYKGKLTCLGSVGHQCIFGRIPRWVSFLVVFQTLLYVALEFQFAKMVITNVLI